MIYRIHPPPPRIRPRIHMIENNVFMNSKNIKYVRGIDSPNFY